MLYGLVVVSKETTNYKPQNMLLVSMLFTADKKNRCYSPSQITVSNEEREDEENTLIDSTKNQIAKQSDKE